MHRGGPCGPLTISANITYDLGEYLRQIVHTFSLVLPMFCSLAGVLLIFMNLFAVVGMELFGGERPHASCLPHVRTRYQQMHTDKGPCRSACISVCSGESLYDDDALAECSPVCGDYTSWVQASAVGA